MTSAPPSDNIIPVLTEVISVGDPGVFVPQDPMSDTLTGTPGDYPALSQQAMEQLEKTLCETVLRQLLTRVDFVLEHRVRDGLADVLQTAVEGLAKEIRIGLTRSLEEVIQRTVSQEISKIQSTNNKS